MSKSNPLTKESVSNILNKRKPVTVQHVGQTVTFRVEGAGTIVDVKNAAGEIVLSKTTGMPLQKKIFNCKANSRVAMDNARTRQMFVDGVKAEMAGDVQAADEFYTAFLNSCQLSFNMLLPNAKASKLADGVEITAAVEQITTENGSLLTLDASTVAIKEALVITESTNFNIDDYLPKVAGPKDTKLATA